MKTNKTIAKMVATATMAVASIVPSFAQSSLGAACGCPTPVSSRPEVLVSSLAVVNTSTLTTTTDGNLLGNTVFTCDKTWILDKKIYVPDGVTLTIKPGTVIKGTTSTPGDATALIVSKGGKIFATGTQSCPIVFTAYADAMNGTYTVGNKGQWGGVVLLGKAENNLKVGNKFSASGVDGVGFIEGFVAANSRNQYGMPVGLTDSLDNSGIMSYVSIRHAGAVVGTDNELNGLTCGSVGRGTTLDHIEVISNDDDGIEFFGGNVDIKYATVMFNLDDAFDWDQGYKGRGQFLFLVQNNIGDNGFEMDSDDEKFSPALRSHPYFYNATLIGNGGDVGLEAKELTEGEVYNSVVANFGSGLNLIKALGTRTLVATEAYHNWVAGSFKVKNCTFVGTTNPLAVDGGTANITVGTDDVKFAADGNVSAASIPGFDFTFAIGNATTPISTATTDKYDAIPNPALGTVTTPPVDGFFSPVTYRGAFDASAKSWMSDWSYSQLVSGTTGLVPCPTDIDGNGVTGNSDLLQLLPQFNQNCQ